MAAIAEGKLKAIAVSSKQRFPVFPDVPTFDELGLKDFELTGWFGIVAPGGTPRADRVQAQRGDGCGAQGSRSCAPHPDRRHGADPTTPAEFSAYLDSEIAKAEKLQALADKPN